MSSIALGAVLVLTGCYHATIETGLTPSAVTLEDNWADSWIYGLVPPSTVETASRCPSGVARVETQLTFVNQLVGFLTIGIYTPMSIVVTCAAGEEDDGAETMDVPENGGAIRDVFDAAAHSAAEEGAPVYVRFAGQR